MRISEVTAYKFKHLILHFNSNFNIKENITGGGEALPPRRGGVCGLRPYGFGGVTDGGPRISGVMAVRMSGGKLLRPKIKMDIS